MNWIVVKNKNNTQKINSSLTSKENKDPILSLPPRYTFEMVYRYGTHFVRVFGRLGWGLIRECMVWVF